MLLFPTDVAKIHQVLSYLAAQPRPQHGPAIQALQWDLLAADALHLSDWGRPLTGDQWSATAIGPMGLTITALVNQTPFVLSMMTREERRQVPSYLPHRGHLTIDETGPHTLARLLEAPERLLDTYDRLSESDRICLDALKTGSPEIGSPETDPGIDPGIDGLAAARARAEAAWQGALGMTIPYTQLLTAEQQADEDVIEELRGKAQTGLRTLARTHRS